MQQVLRTMSGQIFLLAVLGIYAVDGATFNVMGPCPDGVASGAAWTPEFIPATQTPSQCMECQCSSGRDSYSCASCGVIYIELSGPQCYTTKSQPDAPYPDCCEVKAVCPGDAGYNPSLAGSDNGVHGAAAKR